MAAPAPQQTPAELPTPRCLTFDPSLVAQPFRAEVQATVARLTALRSGRAPLLVGFLANDDASARKYAKWTGRTCQDLGIRYELREVARTELEDSIIAANNDSEVGGILVYCGPYFPADVLDILADAFAIVRPGLWRHGGRIPAERGFAEKGRRGWVCALNATKLTSTHHITLSIVQFNQVYATFTATTSITTFASSIPRQTFKNASYLAHPSLLSKFWNPSMSITTFCPTATVFMAE